MTTRILISTTFAFAMASCDRGSQPPPQPPTADDGGMAADDGGADAGAADGGAADDGGAEPGAPGVPWAEKTFKQRQEFMGIEVLPAMKKAFVAYDGNQYKGFKCQTCHGDDMNETKYKMPSDSIYPLSPKDTIKKAMDYDAKVTKYMQETVVPEMVRILGVEPWSAENPKGFGCFSCHPTE